MPFCSLVPRKCDYWWIKGWWLGQSRGCGIGEIPDRGVIFSPTSGSNLCYCENAQNCHLQHTSQHHNVVWLGVIRQAIESPTELPPVVEVIFSGRENARVFCEFLDGKLPVIKEDAREMRALAPVGWSLIHLRAKREAYQVSGYSNFQKNNWIKTGFLGEYRAETDALAGFQAN